MESDTFKKFGCLLGIVSLILYLLVIHIVWRRILKRSNQQLHPFRDCGSALVIMVVLFLASVFTIPDSRAWSETNTFWRCFVVGWMCSSILPLECHFVFLLVRKLRAKENEIGLPPLEDVLPEENKVDIVSLENEREYFISKAKGTFPKHYISCSDLTDSGTECGYGNFAVVRKQTLRPLNIEVAVKISKAMDSTSFDNLLTEAKTMSELRHPNVLGLEGISVSLASHALIIMPFMPNGSLRTYLPKFPNTSWAQKLRFCKQIAAAMNYIGENKLVHNDLAARNCLLDKNTQIKVADFGLCEKFQTYHVGVTLETFPLGWMPTELLETGEATVESDIWSFGVVIWEVITNCMSDPYPGINSLSQLISFLKSGKRLAIPPTSNEVANKMFELANKCWHENPYERSPFAELKMDFNRLWNDLSTCLKDNGHRRK